MLMKTATKIAKPASAKTAKQTKAPVKVTEINLSDKPLDYEDYNDKPLSEVPDTSDLKVIHLRDNSTWFHVPNLFIRTVPQEYEIRLKYEDEEIRITGTPGNVSVGNTYQKNDPAIRLIFDALAYDKDDGYSIQPGEEVA
jgi:hypothetical protein